MKTHKSAHEKTKKLTQSSVPATFGLVNEVREELRSEIRSVDHKIESVDHKIESMKSELRVTELRLESKILQVDSRFKMVDSRFKMVDSRFKSIDSRFKSIDSRFKSIDSRFKQVDANFEKLHAKVETVIVSVHRTQVLMEEQRGENRIVPGGIKTLIERQDRLESEIGDVRKIVEKVSPRFS